MVGHETRTNVGHNKGARTIKGPWKNITHETSEEVGHISHDRGEGKARLDERTNE